jgi:serine/threonine-protein kinase
MSAHAAAADGKRYRIVGRLGVGGMGTVFEATDSRLRRPVALKFARRNDRSAARQLAWEAAVMSLPQHARVCSVYDLSEYRGRICLVLERLVGDTLAARMAGGPLPGGRVVSIGVQIADALTAIHAVGLVHQDIKPSNIFLTVSGDVKVLDFGLAALVGDPSSGRRGKRPCRSVRCTANYVAPERLLGQRADFRSDLYSLGVVLYEMATGRAPFTADSVDAVLDRVLNSEARPLRELAPRLPAALERLVSRLLAPQAQDRPQSAAEVKRALGRIRG